MDNGVVKFLEDNLLKPLAQDVYAAASADKAAIVSAAAAANMKGADLLVEFVNHKIATSKFAAPFAFMIQGYVKSAAPKIVEALGGEEDVIYNLVLAFLANEIKVL